MTIASEITRIKNNIASAYTALSDKGVTLPLVQDSDNLVSTIEQIPAIYDNFTVMGTPSLNFRTGEIFNFSTSNYLLLPNAFNPGNKSWELRMKIKTSGNVSDYQKLFRSCISVPSQAGRMGIFFDIHSKHFECYVTSNGTSWLFGQSGTYTVQTNTTYWLKLGWSGTEYYIDYSLDGINYTRDMSYSSTSPLYDGLTVSQLGVYTYDGGYHEPFLGTMYLDETEIDVDGVLWWTPKTFESEPLSGDVYYVNYDKYGTLQIDTQTGIVTGFINNSYILTNKRIDYRPSSFEYQVCFTTGNDVNTTQFLISDFSYNGNVFGLDSGKFIWYVSSNTSSWDILNGITGTTNLSPNTKYWTKIVFDGSSYKCYLSTTGKFSGEETTEINVSSSTSIHADTYTYFGIQNLNGSLYCPFLGSIDLSMTHIKRNGEFLWSAGIVIN